MKASAADKHFTAQLDASVFHCAYRIAEDRHELPSIEFVLLDLLRHIAAEYASFQIDLTFGFHTILLSFPSHTAHIGAVALIPFLLFFLLWHCGAVLYPSVFV